MSGYLSIPLLAAAVIVQFTVVPELRVAGGAPDLVFLLVLAWSLMAGFERGVVWALVGGILQDIVSAVPVGTTSLSLVIAIALAGAVLGRVNPRNLVVPALAAAGGIVVAQSVTQLVLTFTGRPLPVLDLFVYVTLPSIPYNAVVMLGVYRVLGGIYLTSRPSRVAGL